MLKPLEERVVVRRKDAEDTTKSGIILSTASKEKSQIAEVIAVGEGKRNSDGTKTEMLVKTGDNVLISKYAGDSATIKYEGEELIIIEQSQILAIVE